MLTNMKTKIHSEGDYQFMVCYVFQDIIHNKMHIKINSRHYVISRVHNREESI